MALLNNPAPKVPNEDLLDKFFPCKKVAKVQRTSPEKDAFDLYRPSPGYCLDYNISQTYTKFDVGDKKISFRQTKATYVTPKNTAFHKKIIYSHSAAPCFQYANEVRAKKIEKMQKVYIKRIEEAQITNSSRGKAQSKQKHAVLQKMAGPEWFQELSPAQLANIETLKKCIEHDIFCNSINKCQEAIAKLGLVLRPNAKQLQKALKLCCGRPEEFLLQLYNIINPKRIEYSINDRLLISSVVHLSMENTLRELHVRIPSPPPRPVKEPPKRKKMKVRKKVLKSPYLEKLVFTPREKKKCAIRRIYRPYIPYFDYIPKLRKEIKQNYGVYRYDIENIKDEKELELIEETQLAQETYNEVTLNEAGVLLIKPSYLEDLTCMNPEEEVKTDKDKKKVKKSKDKHKKKAIQAKEEANDASKKKNQKKESSASNKIQEKGPSNFETKDPCEIVKDYLDGNVDKEESEDNGIDCKDVCIQCVTWVLDGKSESKGDDVNEPQEPISFCVTGNPNAEPPKLKYPDQCSCYMPNTLATPIVMGGKMTPSGHMIPIIQGVRENKCSCLEHFENELKKWEQEKIKVRQRLNLKTQTHKYVVQGVVSTPNGPVYILGSVLPSLPNYGLEDWTLTDYRNTLKNFDIKDVGESPKYAETVKINEIEKQKEPSCECKKRLDSFLNKQCKCEKCKAIDRKNNPFFISGGSIETSEGLVPVIGGVCIQKCNCLEQYAQKLKEYEYARAIKMAKKKLKESKLSKHIIGGVTITPSGPVYNIMGVKPRYRCRCKELYFEKLDETCRRKSNYVNDDHFVRLENPQPPPKYVSKECRACKNHYEKFISKQCDCEKCNAERRLQTGTCVISGSKMDECGNLISVIGGVKQPTCTCVTEYNERIKEYEYGLSGRDKMRELRKQNLIIGGIVRKSDSPEFVISGMFKGEDRFNPNDDTTEIYISPEDQDIMQVCKCRQELEKFFSKKCRCKKCMEAKRKQNLAKVNGEVVSGKSREEIYPEGSIDTYGELNLGFMESSSTACTHEENPEEEDVYEENKCGCLLKYTEKLKQYEEYKRRITAMLKLQAQTDKYVVGGVVNTQNGPVYIISGVRQPAECKCAEMIKKQLETERMMAIMPKAPGGRVTYNICGVRETDEGNVFILSNAKAIQECPCMDMFKKFETAHAFCSDFYDTYLKQMMSYINEYILDLDRQREIYREEKELSRIDGEMAKNRKFIEECNKLIKDNELFMRDEPIISKLPFEINPDTLYVKTEEPAEHLEEEGEWTEENDPNTDKENTEQKRKSLKHNERKSSKSSKQEERKASRISNKEKRKSSRRSKKEEHKTSRFSDQKEDKTNEGQTGKKVNIGEEKTTKQETKFNVNEPRREKKSNKRHESVDKSATPRQEDVKRKSMVNEVKRFFILKSFPKTAVEQQELLKAALATLEEDGFYIAKLPDCHKLPHFKLWMEMRSGKYWTPKDTMDYWLVTKSLTNIHLDHCYKEGDLKLPFSREEIKAATWEHSDYYKAMIHQVRDKYYRTVKQSVINNSREFYPALFNYEFYSERFRSTFFALTPAKEEEVFPFKIVKSHEFYAKNQQSK